MFRAGSPHDAASICLVKNVLLLGKNDLAVGPETYF